MGLTHWKTCPAEFVKFEDLQSGEVVDSFSVEDESFGAGMGDQVESLASFLARPVKLGNYSWAEGNQMYSVSNPWTVFFQTPAIYNKVKGFGKLQCKLRLKFIISGSPYQYGAMMVSWKPLCSSTINQATGELNQEFDFSGGLVDQTFLPSTFSASGMMARSTRHKVMLYPHTCEGAEMTLPFIHYKNHISPVSLSATGGVYSDTDEMGQLTMESLTSLRVAGTATGNPITITVYAWAEDVKLFGSTMLVQGLDEYALQPVSATASAVADAAGALSRVPMLEPFMRPTEMVVGKLGQLARAWGFGNPAVIDNIRVMKQESLPGLACPGIGVQQPKLSIDPKNEVNVDPRTVGMDGTDDMVIRNFVTKECFIDQYQWMASQTSGTLLWASVVTPELWHAASLLGSSGSHNYNAFQGTPAAHICAAFSYWRGTIKFRFQIVAPIMYRGRLKVMWDPCYQSVGTTTVYPVGEGVLRSEIFDIGETNSFEFVVPFAAPYPWCATDFPAVMAGYYTKFGSSLASLSSSAQTNNGIVYLEVQSRLTGTDTTEPVNILMWTSVGDDFEVSGPRDINFATAPGASYAMVTNLGSQAIQGKDGVEPATDGGTTVSMKAAPSRHHALSTVGESIPSIRPYLHRYCPSLTLGWSPIGGSDWGYFTRSIGRFPPFPGAGTPTLRTSLGNSTTEHVTATPTVANVNFLPMSFLHWMAPCYTGWRGSINWKVVQPPPISGFTTTASVTISRSNTKATYVETNYSLHPSSDSYAAMTVMPHGTSGIAVCDGVTETGVSATVPHYAMQRMMPANPLFLGTKARADTTFYTNRYGQDTDAVQFSMEATLASSSTPYLWLRTYVAAGDDFSLFGYMNPPTIYKTLYGITPSTTV